MIGTIAVTLVFYGAISFGTYSLERSFIANIIESHKSTQKQVLSYIETKGIIASETHRNLKSDMRKYPNMGSIFDKFFSLMMIVWPLFILVGWFIRTPLWHERIILGFILVLTFITLFRLIRLIRGLYYLQ